MSLTCWVAYSFFMVALEWYVQSIESENNEMKNSFIVILSIFVLFISCKKKPTRVVDSPQQGEISMVVDESFSSITQALTERYMAHYPETKIKVEIKKEEQYGNYVSLLPFSPVVTKITTTGMKYPLLEEDLPWFLARGVSNEIVDHVATIKFDTGVLLVIESKD